LWGRPPSGAALFSSGGCGRGGGEPALGQIVKRVAEACGFEVIVTNDPSAFTQAARRWHPTVIMLDLKMPGTDGVQLLRSLAADNCTAHVVLTSGSDVKIVESAMRPG